MEFSGLVVVVRREPSSKERCTGRPTRRRRRTEEETSTAVRKILGAKKKYINNYDRNNRDVFASLCAETRGPGRARNRTRALYTSHTAAVAKQPIANGSNVDSCGNGIKHERESRGLRLNKTILKKIRYFHTAV